MMHIDTLFYFIIDLFSLPDHLCHRMASLRHRMVISSLCYIKELLKHLFIKASVHLNAKKKKRKENENLPNCQRL